MKWAVYIDDPAMSEYDITFYPDEKSAREYVKHLIETCEAASVDEEKNLFWDITLMEVKGEAVWNKDGLILEARGNGL